jgi:hypothetical protein
MLPSGRQATFANRAAWAHSYLKQAGLISSPKRGTYGYVEAFARLGARLANPQWAVSAITDDGALVVSCWQHLFKRRGRRARL